jgi:hypothetical protein
MSLPAVSLPLGYGAVHERGADCGSAPLERMSQRLDEPDRLRHEPMQLRKQGRVSPRLVVLLVPRPRHGKETRRLQARELAVNRPHPGPGG